jgi:hypothetical protein
MKVEGSCHCGQIKYEAEVDPGKATICNCTDCQVMSGTGYRVNVPTNPGTFRYLSGTPSTYIKTAESGNKRRHAFCPNCGAPIAASANVDNPDVVSLRIGGLAQKAQLAPQRQIWTQSALAWSRDVSGVPGTPKG